MSAKYLKIISIVVIIIAIISIIILVSRNNTNNANNPFLPSNVQLANSDVNDSNLKGENYVKYISDAFERELNNSEGVLNYKILSVELLDDAAKEELIKNFPTENDVSDILAEITYSEQLDEQHYENTASSGVPDTDGWILYRECAARVKDNGNIEFIPSFY